jgi:hypothetical protein
MRARFHQVLAHHPGIVSPAATEMARDTPQYRESNGRVAA